MEKALQALKSPRVQVVGGIAAVTLGTVALARRYSRFGPHAPLWFKLFGGNVEDYYEFEEHVSDPRVSLVVDAFKNFFYVGREVNAQLCLYWGGKKVLDIVGKRKGEEYSKDSLHIMFSTTKVFLGLVFAKLVDMGLMEFDDPVYKHWPEFAADDPAKKAVKISDFLQHQSGIPTLGDDPKALFGFERIPYKTLSDLDRVAQILEKVPLQYEPGSRRMYHFTSQFYLGELCRRIDPKGRTVGQLFKEEFATPLGVDFFMGDGYPPRGAGAQVVDLIYPSKVYSLVVALMPVLWGKLGQWVKALAGRDQTDAEQTGKDQMVKEQWAQLLGNLDQTSLYSRCRELVDWGDPDPTLYTSIFHIHDKKRAEIPALHEVELTGFNGISNARSMARVLAMLAGKGQLEGRRLLKESTCDKIVANPVRLFDENLQYTNRWTNGGMHCFIEGSYGWGGLGGLFQVYDHNENISAALTVNGQKHFLEIQHGRRLPGLMAAFRKSIEQSK